VVQTFSGAYLAGEVLRFASRGSGVSDCSERLAKALKERCMALRGTSGATHIYTMLGEGGEFVWQAKNAGLGVVGDVYIALSSERIVAAEAERYADWNDEPLRKRAMESSGERNSVLLSASDLLVCPSEFVRNDIIECYGVEAARTIVAPYGVSPRWLTLETAPEPGRVLFAGSATIRKGIHYLAAAAKLLKGACRVRVAGGVSAMVRNHEDAADLTFLGHLGTEEMAAEFARADVFAFPSLAEGSAGVTAEALGAGVPVVTTKAAGSIVRDGIDGFIVPERDHASLAQAIYQIVSDRSLRERMSKASRERAREFTWDRFASSIIAATSGSRFDGI
jgi:glycosyltransferase involved in cell wall biosynthesis